MTSPTLEMPDLINGADAPLRGIGANWLTDALQTSGAVPAGRITSFHAERIGTGQLSECYRVALDYDDPTSGLPASLIVKLPSQDTGSIEFARVTRIYETEARFYSEFAAAITVRTPRCYYADVSPDTTAFVLLLEDVTHARQGDQFAGATVEQATAVVEQIAHLHASTWRRTPLLNREWLKDPHQFWAHAGANISPLFEAFTTRYDRCIAPEYLRIVARFVGDFGRWLDTLKSSDCLWHSDFRMDNLMLSDVAADPVVVVDWQGLMRGPVAADLSYFIGNSLTSEDRRRHERTLLGHYFEALRAEGVDDLSWQQCQQAYRAQAFSSLVVTLISSVQVEQTERGDEMFASMVQRAAEQVLDNDSFAALPR